MAAAALVSDALLLGRALDFGRDELLLGRTLDFGRDDLLLGRD